MVRTGVDTGSRMVDCDCDCHCMIDEATAESSQYGVSVKTKLTILASTDRNQVGKSVSEFFKADGEAAGMFLNLAQAARLITHEQREASRVSGVGLDVDENLLKGRQVCCKIKMKPNLVKNPVSGQYEPHPEKPGPYPRIGFDTFDVYDAKAKSIPKDQQCLQMWPPLPGQNPPPSPPAGNGAATHPQQPTNPPASAPVMPAAGGAQDANGIPLNW